MPEIASTRVYFEFWRIHVLIRHEGWRINHKRIYRLYNYMRNCLAIVVAQSLTGDDVVHALLAVATEGRACPSRLQADNGSEFISLSLNKCTFDRRPTLDSLLKQILRQMEVRADEIKKAIEES